MMDMKKKRADYTMMSEPLIARRHHRALMRSTGSFP